MHLVQARAAETAERGAVRFVVGGFEDYLRAQGKFHARPTAKGGTGTRQRPLAVACSGSAGVDTSSLRASLMRAIRSARRKACSRPCSTFGPQKRKNGCSGHARGRDTVSRPRQPCKPQTGAARVRRERRPPAHQEPRASTAHMRPAPDKASNPRTPALLSPDLSRHYSLPQRRALRPGHCKARTSPHA